MAINTDTNAPSATLPPVGPPEKPIRKSEFARRRGVSAARVTQWIAAGQISPAALEGEGRTAKIIESLAIADLRANLNLHLVFACGFATDLRAGRFAQNEDQAARNTVIRELFARLPELACAIGATSTVKPQEALWMLNEIVRAGISTSTKGP